jgi:hypothetical protein
MSIRLKIKFFLSILLLCITVPAFSQNTLVTGVISDQNGQMPNDILEVRILAGKKKVAECKARDGLFMVDLEGLAAPDAELTILLREHLFDFGDEEKSRNYSEAKMTVTLMQAQNLHLKTHFVYEKDHPNVGPYASDPGI